MKRAAIVLAVLAAASACRRTSSDATDAGAATITGDVARGEYLVKAVAACGECHTPRRADGTLDTTMWLAGVPDRFDVEPDDDARGSISTPNLTPHANGLGTWTDADVRSAIVDGIDHFGAPLYPLMPSYVFHNLAPADADAIVAYLRSIPAIDHAIPARQPLSNPPAAPAEPIADSAIPHSKLKSSDPNRARAEHGRYLAAEAGICMDCHTAWRLGASQPLALDRLFAGGRGFSAKEWVVTDKGATPIVFSYNITPDESGIKGWTPQQVVDLLKTEKDDQHQPVCRPMPGGPDGSHGGLTDDDALDIGWYLTTIPAIDSGDIPQCPQFPDVGADGGADSGDASAE